MQSYFKCYQSIFENETYVTEMTDLEKVLYMLVLSENNRKQSEAKATGRAVILRTTHFYMASALSCSRPKITEALNKLKGYGFYDYTGGHYVSDGRTAPSTITNIHEPEGELFAQIDRYTFEYLLYEKLKKGEIKHRHIVVYALCKYIEQFMDGSISVNDFGRMLGMTVKVVNWSRIKEPLLELEAMGLVSFEKARGKIHEIKAISLPESKHKQFTRRMTVKNAADKLRSKEMGINNNTTAHIDDLPTPDNLEDVLDNVRDLYIKQTGKKAVISSEQKRKIQSTTFGLLEMHILSQQFFADEKQFQRIRETDGKTVFGMFANYILTKQLEQMF